jgi:hypothetical protein
MIAFMGLQKETQLWSDEPYHLKIVPSGKPQRSVFLHPSRDLERATDIGADCRKAVCIGEGSKKYDTGF